jgi:ABC-type Fe3+/spermidine/putrescine transport system ATPase subunit
MMFQSYALFPHMNVADNIAYGLKRAGVAAEERRSRIAAALDLVGLQGLETRRPQQLSGGQKQRLSCVPKKVVNIKRVKINIVVNINCVNSSMKRLHLV